MSKRWLALLLSILILLGALSSCDQATTPSDTTVADTTTSLAQPEETDPILSDNELPLKNYTLIYPENLGYEVSRNISEFKKQAEDDMGILLTESHDYQLEAQDTAYEILIGNTNRPESKAALTELRAKDYLIRYIPETNRIVILGGSDESTNYALSSFRNSFLRSEKKAIAIPQGNTHYYWANYTIGDLTIDGVNLRQYAVVIPKKADLLTYSAALNIVDFFTANMGITLPLIKDSQAEREFEFLVGNTSRAESTVSCSLSQGEYLLMQKDKKIVLQGYSYMVGGAFGALVQEHIDISGTNRKIQISGLPTQAVAKPYVFPTEANNAILMIGDGMGFNQVEMAKQNGMGGFVAELLPSIGSAITRSYSVLTGAASYTDSAAAGTALATGYKTFNGRVGKNSAGEDVTNLRELAFRQGARTAVVTTDEIVGATPAAFLGHVMYRDESTRLYIQIDQLIKSGEVDYCRGSLEDLVEHTRTALMNISSKTDPFFAMIEEAFIDKNCHNANMSGCYNTVSRFNDTIAYVIEFVLCHPGTVLVITADHETGGLTKADQADAILEVIRQQSKNAYYTQTESFIKKVKNFVSRYGFAFTSYTSASSCEHTNADVPVYAIGPGTEIFHNTAIENIDIARFIAKVFGEESFGQTEEVPPRA